MNGKAYVGGGVSLVGGNPYAVGDFYEYDPTLDTWSAVPGFPGPPRQYATPLVINGAAYAIGGFDDDNGKFYNLVSEFGTCSEITGILPVTGGNTKSGIEIYPNPSTNDVNVKINDEVNGEVKFEVVSIDGKLIKTGTARQNTFHFSGSNLSDGFYILAITDYQGIRGEQRFEVIH